MAKAFLFNHDRCSGCRNCQIVCKDEHCGYAWLPYAEAQPDIGQFWIKINEKERGQVPVVSVSYVATLCNHCADAPCAAACDKGAFVRRADGLLVLEPENCDGCGDCLEACPLGAIFLNEELSIAQKCTGCAHLLDDGWSVPRCVEACSTEALLFGEEEELDLSGAVVLDEVQGLGSKVYYRNLPKRFVAGCVYDPDINEVLVGAQVSLLDSAGNVVASQETDAFGDWKFDQIEPAEYTVSITANEYPTTTLKVDVSTEDRFTGDLALKKQA